MARDLSIGGEDGGANMFGFGSVAEIVFPLDHAGSAMIESSSARAVPIAVEMRRRTLLAVPTMPTLPASLTVRRARVEETAALAALLGRAYPAETWDAAGTEHELFGDETVRATLVVAAEGRLIATASLQVRPDAPECGWVRWVATEKDRRREGLARATFHFFFR